MFDVVYENIDHDVAVANLGTGETRILVENAGCPKYVSGHLLFGREGIVYAAPFDVERSELRSPPVPVLEGVFMWSSPGDLRSATSPTFASEPPRKLFDLPEEVAGGWDVSPDGQSFVIVELDPFELRPLDLVVVPDWVEEMEARLSAAN